MQIECSGLMENDKCENYDCIFHGDRSECYSNICNVNDILNLNPIKGTIIKIDIIHHTMIPVEVDKTIGGGTYRTGKVVSVEIEVEKSADKT